MPVRCFSSSRCVITMFATPPPTVPQPRSVIPNVLADMLTTLHLPFAIFHLTSVLRMIAIVSDIHSNLEALTVVIGEIDRRGITQVFCLGDVVGYGPNPMECLDLVRQRCKTTLMGNHDFAVLYEPFNFNSGAE